MEQPNSNPTSPEIAPNASDKSSAIEEAVATKANDNLRAFKEKENKTAENVVSPSSQTPVTENKTDIPKVDESEVPKTDNQISDKHKTPTPAERREARIKELKRDMANLKEKLKNADDVEKKLIAFETEKLERQQKAITRENYYDSAEQEQIPDKQYYKDLCQYYGPKIDTPELDQAISEATNKHGVLYCLMQWFDEYPTAINDWKALSPMAIKRIVRNTDQIITQKKAERNSPVNTPAATPAGKPLPKAVVAESSDSTSPGQKKDVKNLKPADALRHFKMYGASGSYDE